VTDVGEPRKAPRGWLVLYAIAFVVMLTAGAMLAAAARDFLGNTSILWASTVLSAGAIVLAVIALVLPRRR
jgi:hypothetical protein